MYTVLWKCLDKEGLDACRITQDPGGWTIEGTAIFHHQSNIASTANLHYQLRCDSHWASQEATVQGWVGTRNIDLHIARDAGGTWLINAQPDHSLDGLVDIDLGFTPASNTNAIRRLNLQASETASTIAVWLDADDWQVKRLQQTYHRVSPHAYDYTSPEHHYRARLEVTDFGAVSEYPGLWRMLGIDEKQ
ncbi:putative glycolipid-binding domain-containing protein [Comamonas testosteroni]